ncbi:MAG: LysM peptidoglycan-binding domain-containing protein [Anaerolineae bacterium]
MKSARFLLPPLLGLLVVLLLLAGCYMPAAPDVTPTPSQQEMEDVYMATLAAQAAQANLTMTAMATAPPAVTETPTPLPPATEEITPSPTPTEVLPPLPVETPTPIPAPSPTTEAFAAPVGTERTHTVQPGEWLLQIARQYGVDWRELAAYNNIVNPHRLYPGQVLRIPGTGGPPPGGNEILYTVQPGDNLFRIALRYNMNYLYLASYNNITNPHQIRVGQVIRIPVTP